MVANAELTWAHLGTAISLVASVLYVVEFLGRFTIARWKRRVPLHRPKFFTLRRLVVMAGVGVPLASFWTPRTLSIILVGLVLLGVVGNEYREWRRSSRQITPPASELKLAPITLMPGGVDDGSERASDDPQVRVRYTERQRGPLRVGLRLNKTATNHKGEVELRHGHARKVRLYVDLVNELQTDIERAHVTILFPDAVIDPEFITFQTRTKFDQDLADERMTVDSEGSLRYRAFVSPLVGRGNVNEIPILVDVHYAREIPVRVIVSANELSEDVSFYGAIVAVMEIDKLGLVTSLIAEGSALLPQTVDTTFADGSRGASTQPGSGDWQSANSWLRRAREAMRLHFGEQAYRVHADLDQDASSAQVAYAIEKTMPALQNWRNSLT